MRLRLPLLLLLCTTIILDANAQNVPYKAYLSASGPFGQPHIRYQFTDNILYSGASRFGVTYTSPGTVNPDGLFDGAYDSQPCIIPAGGTAVITIDFTTKGGSAYVYPLGKVQLHFYSGYIPQSVSGRMMKTDGTWYDITGWTNVSTIAGNAVWEGATNGSYNNAQTLEITVVAPSGAAASLNEIEYILQRPGVENGTVNKFTNQTLFKNFEWRDLNNQQVALIKNDGGAYFKSWLGIGTPTATSTLHVVGTAQITGNAKLGSLTITANALAGRVLTTDASGNGTWQTLPAAAGGWALTGNTGDVNSKFGTTGAFDLSIITTNLERIRISKEGNIGIGIVPSSATIYKLQVNGTIRTKKVRVDNDNWPDYVFKPDYKLMPLHELATFIQKNNHLPELPTAAEVHKEGIDLGNNQATLLKKIEELTLYIIDQQKKMEEQQHAIQTQAQRIEQLEKKMQATTK